MPANKCVVIVVDDEELVDEYIQEVLERHGYTHVSFSEPEKALEYFEENHEKVELLITDVRMPIISGLELAEKMAQTNPYLRKLFITGDSFQLPNVRPDQILHKPITKRELMEAVERTISDECKN
ncbi:MAG TPA: response regulator [Syntrophorhabdaceae bacterium]|nr:response regulator [Syntrophorhabdaceae bacterium]